ncbi:MAG: asparagine ligase [Thermoprotei archaeon]|nr:MAG: asparagine ligase [Thermoprotei archaeon]RLE89307.1 MAG: asparagine ligase [Thermoprotei archaeon]
MRPIIGISKRRLIPLESLKHMLLRSYRIVRNERMKRVLKIQATICKAAREYLDSLGFIELLPPIIGPVTDPGIRGAKQVAFDFYGHKYKIMSSAILYKQMMVTALGKIYFFSPNVRLEPLNSVETRRHLVEFVQIDIEKAYANYFEAMELAEGLITFIIKKVIEEHEEDLKYLNCELKVPRRPFKKLSYKEAIDILRAHGFEVSYGKEIPWEGEEFLSMMFEDPFFVYDYPLSARGFYDREDPERPGILRDFDMLYPEGYGEAISGAEREYTVEKVIERMKMTGENPSEYSWYIDMLKEGVVPSAGFGIGIERLTRYVCKLEAIWEARPYPKVAGIYSP